MSQIEVAKHYASQALNYDKSGHNQAASYFYLEAARVINEAIAEGIAPSSLSETANKYTNRADKLAKEDECALSKNVKSEEQACEDRVEFLLSEGLENDEAGKLEEALNLYSQGVEYCLKCAKETKNDGSRDRFRKMANLALERAEHIKKLISAGNLPEFPEVPHDDLDNVEILRDDEATIEPALKEPVTTSTSTLDPLERKVLATTSKINALSFVPFLASDLKERFAYPVPFFDKDGLLKLSEKQKSRLKGWMRPTEFCSEPTLIDKIDSGTIKQNLVSDCSFVASLAISARYERRFKTPLITK